MEAQHDGLPEFSDGTSPSGNATDGAFRPAIPGKDAIAAGSEDYDRNRHLARLIPVGPDEIDDDSQPGRAPAILAKLSRALRAERNRGRAGHWTYDLNRHIGLSQAYAAERRLLGEAATARRPPKQKRRREAGAST